MSPYWDWPGTGHMWGAGGFGWMFPLLMMIFVIGVGAFFLSRVFGGGPRQDGDITDSALRLLNERFAKGEISKEELEEKRSVLARTP